MKYTIIAAALLALLLYGCSGEQPEIVINQIAEMETELAEMEKELTEVKAKVGDLKSELETCTDELTALAEKKLQEAEGVADDTLQEVPAPDEHPAGTPPDHPTGAIE